MIKVLGGIAAVAIGVVAAAWFLAAHHEKTVAEDGETPSPLTVVQE